MESVIRILKNANKEQLLKKTLEKVHDNQVLCNSFVTIMDNAKLNPESDSVLSNIPYVLKDNYSTKGILTTGSSNTLKDYIPPYSSTVYEKLSLAGAIMVAKSVMDEFGMGGTGLTGHTGIVRNPWDTSLIAGGSSAGSAASVAAGVVPFAIGSDTGDSVRKPAAHCGIVGYKPTYGMISRWGLLPFASSLDHVGVFARTVSDVAIVVDVLKGKDEKDMTTWDSSNINLEAHLNDSVKGKKLFYFKELCDISFYENPSDDLKKVIEEFNNTINVIKRIGIDVVEESFPKELLDAIPSVYTCISCAEATSNMSNLTGIIFGPREDGNINEMIINHRTLNFSSLIKRRFIIGSYVLQRENQEKYFVNALRVRNRIVRLMKEKFNNYDGLILPCSASHAPKIHGTADVIRQDLATLENHMAIGNFGGFPSITIPNGMIDGLPIGVNITGNIYDDENVLAIASHIADSMPYEGQIAGDNK